jgi:hypothetical protein
MIDATREKTRLWLLILVGVVATLLGQTHAREILALSPHVSGVFAAQTQASTGQNYDACPCDVLDSLIVANRVGKVEQYALTATESGFYPVMQRGSKQPQAGIWQEAGEVWKYGTTKNPTTKYSQSFLDKWGLQYEKQMGGTLQDALSSEKSSILKYLDQSGTLPPGNKIVR